MRNRPRWLVGAGVALAILLAAAIVVDLVVAIGLPDSRDKLRGELLGLLVPLAVSIAGAGALLDFWETRRQNLRTLAVTSEQLSLQRRGQIADRFSKAIDQLADRNKLDLRVGAIYALEALARESTELHWPTMEVLTAFIRQYSSSSHEAAAADRTYVPADIQAALTVIGRRNRQQDQGLLDLREVDIRSADLAGAQLQRANFNYAHLEEATFSAGPLVASLEQATLIGAHLEGANLAAAVLTRADLRFAHLHGAILSSAWLDKANLREADLHKANLRWAHLEGANLFRAQTEDADLSDAYLEGANRDLDLDTLEPGRVGPIITLPATIFPDLRHLRDDPAQSPGTGDARRRS